MLEDVRQRPRLSPAEARDLALVLYDVAAAAEELPSERDQNFDLRCADGRRYVLKVANADAQQPHIECQNLAMQHVADRLGETVCPTIRPSTAGQWIAQVGADRGAGHLVRLVRWVTGVPLVAVRPHDTRLLRDVGRFLGQVSRALDTFDHPAAVRVFQWDLAQALDVVQQRRGALRDRAARDTVAPFVIRFAETVLPRVDELRRSVIHGDANDFNILVGEPSSGGVQVSGLIDFGDVVRSCTVFELAVCLAYVMLDRPDPLAAAAEVVAGYQQQYPLTAAELEVLYPSACMRLCVSVTIAAYQQRLDPDNEYLSVSEGPAWAALERLRPIPPSAARDVFRRACEDAAGTA